VGYDVMHGLSEAWAPISLLLQGGSDWGRHGWEGQRWDGSWWPWILFPLLLWGGILFLIARILARLFPRNRPNARPQALRDSAEEILRERFARGEISAEEYTGSLKILRGDAPQAARAPDDGNEDV
jgi:putative membrane protein